MKLFIGGRVLPPTGHQLPGTTRWKGRRSQTTTCDGKTPSGLTALMTGTWALQTFLGCLSCISFFIIYIYFCSHLWHPVCPHHPCRCWSNLEPALLKAHLCCPRPSISKERGHEGQWGGGRGVGRRSCLSELGLGLASSVDTTGFAPFSPFFCPRQEPGLQCCPASGKRCLSQRPFPCYMQCLLTLVTQPCLSLYESLRL